VSAARLRFATVIRGDLVYDVSVQGRVVAANHPRLYSPEPGIVTLRVRPGEGVESGQVLATIESPELEAEIAQESSGLESLRSALVQARIDVEQRNLASLQDLDLARLRLAAAERELERAEKLREQGLLNEVLYDQAADALEEARLEVDHAAETSRLTRRTLVESVRDAERQVVRQELVVDELRRRADELRVVAPFDGLVATLEVDDRDAVEDNQSLLSVVDLSEYEVEVGIPESYADDVAPGLGVRILFGGGEYEGMLVAVSPEVTGSQVEGRVEFTGEPPAGLRQNQRVSTRILLDHREDVLKLPRGPYLGGGAGRRIYVVEDGLARLAEIRVGTVSVTEVEVLEGLEEGQRVLLTDTNQFDGAERVLIRD
jgi:HlyD family secretion protein